MAEQELIGILRQCREEWSTWRKLHRDIRPNFSNANLINADLREAKLSHADLPGAYLIGADLSHADLSYADLPGAYLINADLSRANLSRANLSHTELNNVKLIDADLINADLSHTDLSGANLSLANLSLANLSRAALRSTVVGNVDLRTVQGLDTVKHYGPSTIGTDTLERSQGDIPEVFLRGVGLSDTFIEYARALVKKPFDYYTCFISYSSKDEEFTKRLYNDLQGAGVRCWFAPKDMDIGDEIQYRINESIRIYDKLLLILSKHSVNSTWVEYEIKRALNKEPAGVQNVLYPVRLDKAILTCEMEWVQDIKQTRHIGNFEKWRTNQDAYQESFNRLLRALKPKEATKKAGR